MKKIMLAALMLLSFKAMADQTMCEQEYLPDDKKGYKECMAEDAADDAQQVKQTAANHARVDAMEEDPEVRDAPGVDAEVSAKSK